MTVKAPSLFEDALENARIVEYSYELPSGETVLINEHPDIHKEIVSKFPIFYIHGLVGRITL